MDKNSIIVNLTAVSRDLNSMPSAREIMAQDVAQGRYYEVTALGPVVIQEYEEARSDRGPLERRVTALSQEFSIRVEPRLPFDFMAVPR